MAAFEVEVFRAFIPSTDRDTGKEITIPIMVRRMFLHDPRAIGDSGYYRVSCMVRRTKQDTAILTHTIAVIPRTVQPWWTNPDGNKQVWYTLETEEYKSVDSKKYTTSEIRAWLSSRLGEDHAELALSELHEGIADGMQMQPRGVRRVKKEKEPKRIAGAKEAHKCECGRPVWVGSHTNQCFPCTPAQVKN